MEKNVGFSAANAQPSNLLPTAPPSYEEAIANTGVPMNPPVGSAPYPLGITPVPMAMPMPYNQPPNQITMPAPSASSQSTSQPHFNVESNSMSSVSRPEVRVIHHHLTYALAPNPVKMACPTCHADIKTTTISDHQPSAHVCCIVLCLLGCCLCSCLPYCMSAFMSVHHFCPNCKNYIGTWKG
ncbi:lipopolysaccharide-induced tumor necrosis factor-alpha factor homolog [Linepithema humile]|uniref:lipopolysaccharide-induced tumor necrosis factor-alpha factor homolog n=1 Tax=Linepithema humile TaxID=83485 RepID=UPI00062352D3|nr:PREDICTED: lipopolysaccharide-induced tumor necrosis factor-alpha factor homolog [Linepithema humile]XP_012232328.1 PREDICTED: lipopolysaccharide-induced tumor necrosis factor-alpha factor homolog [Linepithema humile]